MIGNQKFRLDSANAVSEDGANQVKTTKKTSIGISAAAPASHVCQWRNVLGTQANQARQRSPAGNCVNSGIDFNVK
jgi:hypothetical protein